MDQSISADATVAAATTDELASPRPAPSRPSTSRRATRSRQARCWRRSTRPPSWRRSATPSPRLADAEAKLSDDTASGASEAQLAADQAKVDSANDQLDVGPGGAGRGGAHRDGRRHGRLGRPDGRRTAHEQRLRRNRPDRQPERVGQLVVDAGREHDRTGPHSVRPATPTARRRLVDRPDHRGQHRQLHRHRRHRRHRHREGPERPDGRGQPVDGDVVGALVAGSVARSRPAGPRRSSRAEQQQSGSTDRDDHARRDRQRDRHGHVGRTGRRCEQRGRQVSRSSSRSPTRPARSTPAPPSTAADRLRPDPRRRSGADARGHDDTRRIDRLGREGRRDRDQNRSGRDHLRRDGPDHQRTERG